MSGITLLKDNQAMKIHSGLSNEVMTNNLCNLRNLWILHFSVFSIQYSELSIELSSGKTSTDYSAESLHLPKLYQEDKQVPAAYRKG